MPTVLTAAEMLTNAAEHGGPVELAQTATLQALISSRRPRIQSRTQRVTLGTAEAEEGHGMKLTHRFAKLTPEKRPQNPNMDGIGLRRAALVINVWSPLRRRRNV
jgi:hypothetical protein